MEIKTDEYSRARDWSLFIGRVQAMFFGLVILFLTASLAIAGIQEAVNIGLSNTFTGKTTAELNITNREQKPEINDTKELKYLLEALLTISPFFLLGILSSWLLIKGVYQENPLKLMAWLVIHCLALIVLVIGDSIYKEGLLIGYNISGQILLVCAILLIIIAMIIVNIHRKELLAVKNLTLPEYARKTARQTFDSLSLTVCDLKASFVKVVNKFR